MNETAEYLRLLDRVSRAVAVLPRRAAALAVAFSKQRWRDQAWVDNTTEPWKKRARSRRPQTARRARRAVLIDTGRLRRSIRTVYVDANRAIIGTDVPYARAHNDGFRGSIKQQVRPHTRRGRRGQPVRVSAHARTLHMNLPRRRFIGASAILDKQIERMMTAEIIKAIKG